MRCIIGFCTVLSLLVPTVLSPSQSAPSAASPARTEDVPRSLDAPAEASVLHQFEGKFRSANRLQAAFLERYSENGRVVRTEAGRAYFGKPGKMRWEYERPEKNLFLVDGKYVWFYTPADHTVTRVAARQSNDWRTPFMLLAGGMKLSKVCSKVESTSLVAASQAGDRMLECHLKGGQGAHSPDAQDLPSRVFFEISPGGELVRLIVQEAGGIETEFRFKDWVFDPRLPEGMFRFDPPAGVVIVDGLLSSSSSVRQ
jgi:outer membrane lipoprotein carrier protein